MASCLVTGGAGFIGSHVVEALLARGDRVRVLDNYSTGKAENLARVAAEVEILEGDLRDPAGVAAATRGVELVFHQAALVSVPLSLAEPQTCFEINVQGTLSLLEAARREGVRCVVLASSAAVYGAVDVLPVREDSPPCPLSPYAASKQVDEVYADLYTRLFSLPVVALRYFNVYGPRQPPDSAYAAAIPIFLRSLLDGRQPTIYGDGHQVRDFIYVEDVVRANLAAAEIPGAAGLAFNICTGQATSLHDLLATMASILECTPRPRYDPPRPGDIYRSYGDPGRAARVLGFRAETSLASGLAWTVEWMTS